jgi:hypothetical protein
LTDWILLRGVIMNRKWSRKLIYSFIVAVISAIIAMNYAPRNVDIHIKSMMYDENSVFEKLVDMKVKGTIYKYQKGSKKFLGYIEIDGIRQPMNIQQDGRVEFMHHFDSGIIFELDNKYYANDRPIGHLIFMDDLNYVYARLNVLDDNYNSKCIVVGPANSRDEAELIVSKYLTK